jgi:serine/threonine protein kinase
MPILEQHQRFERYRIIRWLGDGVSSESYEAEDTVLMRKVTLKLVHPRSTLPDAARRQFFREMQGISLLNHKYIATVLDYGEIDSRLYVVRRFVSSGSLLSTEGRLWYTPPLKVFDAIQYGHQLAQALDYIHQHGYLHGSLTLSNILVLRGSNVEREPDFAPFLLADIGLANFVRRFGQPSIPHLSITTAPEQLGKHVTPASDQFALAVLLYFWLAGRPPYLGSSEEIEHLKLTETITPLTSLASHVTLEQESIIRRALAVYPEERFPSILAFTEALTATFDTSTIPTRPLFVETMPIQPINLTPLPESLSPIETIPQTDPLLYLKLEPVLVLESEIIAPPAPNAPFGAATSDPGTDQSLQSTSNPVVPPHLIITFAGIEQPYEMPLNAAEITLGKAGSDHILLDQDESASRHHASLKHEHDHFILYDQRSTNGVFVNGQKLMDGIGYTLKDGDRISIGNYELIFHCSTPNFSQITA